MFCTKCGKELPEGAKFCPRCGTGINGIINPYLKNKINETAEKVTKEITDTVEDVSKDITDTINNVSDNVKEAKAKVKVDFSNFNEDAKNFKFSDLLERKYVDLATIAAAIGPLVEFVMIYIILDVFNIVTGILNFVPIIGRILQLVRYFILYLPLIIFLVASVYGLVMTIYRAATFKETDTVHIFQIITCAISTFSLLGYFIKPISWARWIGIILIVLGLDFFVKAIINGEEISGSLDFGQDIAFVKEKIDEMKEQRRQEKEAEEQAKQMAMSDLIKADLDGESTFDGKGITLLGYEVLLSLISLVTCGLATPFAIVKITSWRISHTVINGKRLTFNGTTLQLWGLYIKWFFLTLITCGIYSFFAYVDYKKWEVRHTAYEGTNAYGAIYPASSFRGNSFEYLGYSILTGIVTAITCGIAGPWMACLLAKWQTSNTYYNKQKLKFELTGGKAFLTYLLVAVLTIITCGIYSPWGTCKINKLELEHTHVDPTYVEQ